MNEYMIKVDIKTAVVTALSPGLGMQLNEEVARTYAKEGEPFFQ
ncbi:MAG TPA: hypothetical protein VND22_02330 [Actinomycetota bacterium]|nr:hypothetical protein [Actinomycetota bacterium]